MSEPQSQHTPAHEEQHIVPLPVYFMVFAALLVLTYVTVAVSHVDLGHPDVLTVRVPMNVIVALVIAITKATLVVLFFMHVKYSSRLVQIIVVSSLLWLVILLSVVGDYVSRGWLGNPGT